MKMNTDKVWLKRMAELEDGCVVSVGGLVEALEQKEGAGKTMNNPIRGFIHSDS